MKLLLKARAEKLARFELVREARMGKHWDNAVLLLLQLPNHQAHQRHFKTPRVSYPNEE